MSSLPRPSQARPRDTLARTERAKPSFHAIVGATISVAALAWLVSRVFRGLDFTDEMQYYGEIASLVRTGKLFQGDLFIQQLGYVFYVPFFKLHAWAFPDLRYFVLFGRLLLLATYAATGLLFWGATRRAGGFSIRHRLLGLAALAIWVPFQVFALGYNSMAYLLVVALLSLWLGRTRGEFKRYAFGVAPLLVGLTFAYPPAGLVLIGVTAVEASWRGGRLAAAQLVGLVALGGIAVVAGIVLMEGGQFFSDFRLALEFSRAFGVGSQISHGGQVPNLLVLLGTPTVILIALNFPREFSREANAGVGQTFRFSAVAFIAAAGGALWSISVKSGGGFTATAAYALLLTLLAVAVSQSPIDRASARARRLRQLAALTIVTGATALLLLTVQRSPTAYFATTVFLVLLVVLILTADASEAPQISALVTIGTLMGTVCAISSGNGLHNFGVGAAGAIPFLTLFSVRRLETSGALPANVRQLLLPAILSLFLLNSYLTAYSEERDPERLAPVRTVPAFAGIYTSQTKLKAIADFQRLFADGSLHGRRLLIAGPHPWLYFASGALPATPMFFMHFTGTPAVYEVVAEQLFRTGTPDAILVTNPVPPPIQKRILEWAGSKTTVRSLKFSEAFIDDYRTHTNFDFDREVHLFTRESPPAPR